MNELSDNQLLLLLGRLEGKLDAVIQSIVRHESALDALEIRVTANENMRAKLTGAQVTLSSVLSVIVTLLTLYFASRAR